MPRTRIRGDQEQDLDFVSESELNEFFGKVVITGTLNPDDNDPQDSEVLENFDSFFPGQGLILQEGGVIVTTGTNFVSISGGDASVTQIDDLQVQIDALEFEQAGVGSLTASGVTLSGAIILEGDGTVSLHPSGQTIVISGAGAASTVTDFLGVGEVEVTTEGTTVVISGTPHTEDTDTVSDAIIGGENITVVSGANTTTISSPDVIADALVGAGEVVVTSGVSTITISGTPHTVNTDTVSDAIIGLGEVVVISGADTTIISGTPHTVNTDTVSDALVAGNGIVITSGTSTTAISSFDEDDIDSVTASGITVTGSLTLETVGGNSLLVDNSDTDNPTITISGGQSVGQLIGNFFQIEFTNGGNTANTWLAVSDSNLSSTTTPWVVAFDCRLAALAFSNRNDDVEQDVEIHVAREGDGNTNALEFTWPIRNVRTQTKTDIAIDELPLFPGDKVALFMANQGNNARDVFVGVYVEITERTSGETFEDWTGNIT